LPSDNGGLSIDSYKVEIKTSIDTFEKDTTDCDAENNVSIISSRTCTIPVSSLRTSPFDLANSASVYARVTATNTIGDSSSSPEGNGATIPIPPTVPDAPTSLTKVSASKTQISLSWSAPANNGGTAVLDYVVEMDDNNDDVYSEVATGVSNS